MSVRRVPPCRFTFVGVRPGRLQSPTLSGPSDVTSPVLLPPCLPTFPESALYLLTDPSTLVEVVSLLTILYFNALVMKGLGKVLGLGLRDPFTT